MTVVWVAGHNLMIQVYRALPGLMGVYDGVRFSKIFRDLGPL